MKSDALNLNECYGIIETRLINRLQSIGICTIGDLRKVVIERNAIPCNMKSQTKENLYKAFLEIGVPENDLKWFREIVLLRK